MSLIEADGPLTAKQNLPGKWEADLTKREVPWINLRIPREEIYIWEQGGLTLIPSTDKISDQLGAPTFLAVRQYDMESSFVLQQKVCFYMLCPK